MAEPKYTKVEQTARMRDFERLVKQARRDWRRGYAIVILSFPEYVRLLTAPK